MYFLTLQPAHVRAPLCRSHTLVSGRATARCGSVRESSNPCRLLLVGGFLGAGKTSTLIAAGHILRSWGYRVGVVTNDQGHDLLDTWTVLDAGLDVAEVSGGCFCCRFDTLVEAAARLTLGASADVLLAEAVGSCADLQATVVNPIRRLANTRFSVLPLTVVVEPDRVSALLGSGPGADDLAYLAERQLAEADVILLNKTDRLAVDERDRLTSGLLRLFPAAQILPVSARTGAGMDTWLQAIWPGAASGSALAIDYDRYAAAEAALGWLNASGEVVAASPTSVRRWAETLLAELRAEVLRAGGHIAHIKCAFHPRAAGGVGLRAHLTDDGAVIQVHAADADLALRRATFRLNARVQIAPNALRVAAQTALDRLAQTQGVAAAWDEVECFSPSRPEPTHRMGV